MAQWGNTDDAANSVLWATTSVKKTTNSTNQENLFGNTTAGAFISGATIGQFGVDPNETAAARAGEGAKAAHAGWVLRTVGSGGRAGRVQNEVLVAMSTIGTDAEDTVFKDYSVTITTNPSNASANSSADANATFTVAARTTPTGGSLSYLWFYTTEVGNTNSFATTAAVAGFGGQTTATLTVQSNTIATGTQVRCRVTSGGDQANSAAATLTVTS